jgi:hypothetical protein
MDGPQSGMTWQELTVYLVALLERFEEQEDELPIVPFDAPEAMIRSLSELETRTSRRIDGLIHQLSREEPIVNTSDEAYFLAQRLKYGLAIAQALATPSAEHGPFVPPPAQAGRESMLAWLLIDVWRSTTRNIWISVLHGIVETTGEDG